MALQKKKSNRRVKLVSGLILVLFSSPCVIAMLFDLITGADNLLGALMAGTFFTVLAALGIYLLVLGARTPAEDELIIDANLERKVLRLAQGNDGRLTPAHLTMESMLSLDEAEEVLVELERQGHAQSSVTRGGAVEYVFPSLETGTTLDALESEIESAVEHLEWEDSEQK